MNTKVEEALGVLSRATEGLESVADASAPMYQAAMRHRAKEHADARTALAQHIGEQDAIIAGMRKAMGRAIATLPHMGGNAMSAHTLESELRAALNQEQGK